ncbi:MAG: metalloprotease TldD [Gammaproteobacteria bacterium]|nr:metalloprotease TldD [Gammaproteobacteria bacterium]
MSEVFDTAKAHLLGTAGLSETELERTLNEMLSHRLDSAELFFQSSRSRSWSFEDGIIKEGAMRLSEGLGVRAMSAEKSGFAYADEIEAGALTRAANAARAIAKHGGTTTATGLQLSTGRSLYAPDDPLAGVPEAKQIDLLRRLDAEARKADPRVRQVIASLAAEQDMVLVANSDGTLAGDVRPLIRVNVSVIVESNGRREQGRSGCGGRYSIEEFMRDDSVYHHSREAVRQALLGLEAEDAPAGAMTVVLGPGWPGVLLHEAIGHGLEGDFNRKGSSAFSGRIGEQVAAKGCTVVDDGTLANRRGSLNVDDEGTPTQVTTLIEDGILVGYMQDKLNAQLMGVAATGNGRRESYACLPLPRMTNTYMLSGDRDPQEILESVDNGLYAVNFGGGQVDITSGKFVFSASEAYRIENGKIGAPVKGATLIGNGPDVLQRVSMIGNDLELDAGIGTCGKEGQSVPVGVGQPTLRIEALTVGGTQQN